MSPRNVLPISLVIGFAAIIAALLIYADSELGLVGARHAATGAALAAAHPAIPVAAMACALGGVAVILIGMIIAAARGPRRSRTTRGQRVWTGRTRRQAAQARINGSAG